MRIWSSFISIASGLQSISGIFNISIPILSVRITRCISRLPTDITATFIEFPGVFSASVKLKIKKGTNDNRERNTIMFISQGLAILGNEFILFFSFYNDKKTL